MTLKYAVSSAEYPEWVRQKSPYDDKWRIIVFAGRQRFFAKSQQVNAQLYGDPTWQADGSTGEIQAEIDVTAAAATQDIELTLTCSSENVKDAFFPTTVTAVLGATLKLAINKVENDTASVTPADPNPDARFKVLPTKGDSTYYSIPANGAVGVLTTPITATFNRAAAAATVTPATVRLLDSANVDVDVTVSYDAGTHTATVAPLRGLMPMEVYTIHVTGGSAGVLATDGVALSDHVQWSFRAAAGPLTPSAAYHFTELQGVTTADASGNGNTAVLMGAQWTSAGRLGNGLTFDGASPRWVALPAGDTLGLPDSFTLEVWVRPIGMGTDQELIGRHDAFGNDVSLRLDSNLIPSFSGTFDTGHQNVTAATPLAADAWTHLAVTFDGDYLQLFVNGSEGASTDVTAGGLARSLSTWRIGGTDATPFGGTLDEIRIYRLALTQDELAFDIAMTTDPATVTSLSSLEAIVGDTIVITGTNFGPIQGASTVTIGGAVAVVTNWSDTRIEVIVPPLSTTAGVTVAVNVNGEDATYAGGDPDPLTVRTRPSISSIDPSAAFIGQKVTINGSNFGASQGSSTVTFNGVPATPTSWSDTCIQVTVPEGVTTGPVAVTVNGLTSNLVSFSLSGTTSTGGRSAVTVWSTESGVNADIGTWDGLPEVNGCTFFYVDIDVTAGGGSLMFTYNQRKLAVPVNDRLDVYILTPGTTWNPGDIWSTDGTIRCFRTDYPSGVIPVIDSFIWQSAPGETGDYQFERRLDEWQNQKIRVVFRHWFDGCWGYLPCDEDTQTRIRDLKFTPLRFVIETPPEKSLHLLSENDYRETTPIAFSVKADVQTGVVSWTADRKYQTTSGRATNPETDTFETQPGATATRTYLGKGGQVTIQATSTINGARLTAGPSKFYVAGMPIPDQLISARLVSLYGGATPDLMKGIAQTESSYRQFTLIKHPAYDIDAALWPYEARGGRYVGLMQVPLSLEAAWDWHKNTEQGLAIFREHQRIALIVENRIRAKYPNLPASTGEQRENMTLVGYGGWLTRLSDEQRQYYIQSPDGTTWLPNMGNQPKGIDYVAKVRSNISVH